MGNSNTRLDLGKISVLPDVQASSNDFWSAYETLEGNDVLSNTNKYQSRTRRLGNISNPTGDCVVYVMSRDQRIHDNHALLAAQQKALELRLPMAVVFVVYALGVDRAREHYDFMLGGLSELETTLNTYNIPFITLIGDPSERLDRAFVHFNPAVVYFDFSPLRGPRSIQTKLANKFPVYVVDSHNIVPVWQASYKQEFSARTLRSKIHKLLPGYLIEPARLQQHPFVWPGKNILSIGALTDRIDDELANIKHNSSNITLKSGEQAALRHLKNFIDTKLKGYAAKRNDPSFGHTSGLSPYLHFGQISSLRVILELQNIQAHSDVDQADIDAIIEEMVIRKELSDNYCYYNENYDNLRGAPTWAQLTLDKHCIDPRGHIYSLEELVGAQTHDPAWNTAQRQMMTSGLMHGYMRMYWAKKVLEWSENADIAIRNLIFLNDFYSLDGGDPNGYTGIMWSVAGLHDRPWGERPIYGTVRCMVYSGLKRKFDIQKYIDYNN